jgi:RNA polymerase sigma factor (sigma-70 family)
VERCRHNDAKAQYELYKLYKKAMFNVAMRILNDMGEAEDVLQESFLAAFQQVSNFKGESSFGLWLKKIVVNRAIRVAKQKRLVLASISDDADVPEDATPDYAWQEDQIQLIRKAIQQLPDGYRIVLSLYLLEGYDHAEIAEICNISEATSKSQYSRARKKLLELLPQQAAV